MVSGTIPQLPSYFLFWDPDKCYQSLFHIPSPYKEVDEREWGVAVMPSNQCLWLLRQLTLFAWLYSLAHKKRTLHVQENVEKKSMFLTDSYYFDGRKTFRLTLKP